MHTSLLHLARQIMHAVCLILVTGVRAVGYVVLETGDYTLGASYPAITAQDAVEVRPSSDHDVYVVTL